MNAKLAAATALFLTLGLLLISEEAAAGTLPLFSYSFPASGDNLAYVETVRDLSAAGHNAIPSGFPVPGPCLSANIPSGMPAGTMSVEFGSTNDARALRTFDRYMLNSYDVAAAGGFAFDLWFYSFSDAAGAAKGHDLINYSGTESLVLKDGKVTVLWDGAIDTDLSASFSVNTWHHAVLRFDTLGNTAVQDGSQYVYKVDGRLTLYLDGAPAASKALTKRGRGDSADGRIGIGCYVFSFMQAPDFSGYIYNPSAELGVVPEPSALALSLGALIGLALGAWRSKCLATVGSFSNRFFSRKGEKS